MAASASSVGRHLLHIDEGRLQRQASLHRSEKGDGIPDEEAPRFAVILPENRVSPDRDVRQVGGGNLGSKASPSVRQCRKHSPRRVSSCPCHTGRFFNELALAGHFTPSVVKYSKSFSHSLNVVSKGAEGCDANSNQCRCSSFPKALRAFDREA